MSGDHFFDWKGFMFAAKVVVLCIVAGTLGRYGLLYAAESHSIAGPSLVLIQEAHPAVRSLSLALSTTTSAHIINTLAINDAVPAEGKFIAADLRDMVLTLYEDGIATAKYPIRAKAVSDSPYETPPGFYTVLKKEPDHFNGKEQMDLPWSVQFSGNYFIHGQPYQSDGSPARAPYGGGDIGLASDDAKAVYDFASIGTGIFVFDPATVAPSLALDAIPFPSVSAAAYLVADIDTGDVYLEQNAEESFPLGSTVRLMAALAANEAFPVDAKSDSADLSGWMNAKAKALDMRSTFFDTVATSTEDVSTADDLFRLAAYLANRKSYILNSTALPDPVVSIASVPINGAVRRAAIVVLKSKKYSADASALTDWFTQSALQGADLANTACISCGVPPPYRKIQF